MRDEINEPNKPCFGDDWASASCAERFLPIVEGGNDAPAAAEVDDGVLELLSAGGC